MQIWLSGRALLLYIRLQVLLLLLLLLLLQTHGLFSLFSPPPLV
jgi:hypothetical protein